LIFFSLFWLAILFLPSILACYSVCPFLPYVACLFNFPKQVLASSNLPATSEYNILNRKGLGTTAAAATITTITQRQQAARPKPEQNTHHHHSIQLQQSTSSFLP
jgi:hypothetical protein